MRHASKDKALWFPDIEAIRSHMEATDVVGLVVVDRVGGVRAGEVVQRDLAISDIVHIDQGVLSQEELLRITSIWGRIGYSASAMWKLGPLGWWNAEGFLHATTELAFTRHRAAEGEVGQAEVESRRAVLLPYLATRPL